MGSIENQPREPFEAPLNKKDKKKKREKAKKVRIHAYLSEDIVKKIDERAEVIGLDRSPTIQILLIDALKRRK